MAPPPYHRITPADGEQDTENADEIKARDTSKWRQRHDQRIDAVEAAVLENTKITAEIKRNTDDIVEFFQAGQGTFKFLRMVGGVAKWFTAVAAAVAVVFLMWKSGGKP